jgi:hypothetical protein
MKHNTTPTFDTAETLNDKDLLATLLSSSSGRGKKSKLTEALDTVRDGEFVKFETFDKKRLAIQIAAYNARHDSHFILRVHDLTAYAIKVTKPAKRNRKSVTAEVATDLATLQAQSLLESPVPVPSPVTNRKSRKNHV